MMKTWISGLAIACSATLLTFCATPAPAPPPNAAVVAVSSARATSGFTLPDVRTKAPVSLSDYRDRKAIVVVFIGTECMITNGYLPKLADLSAEYAAKGVAFLAINANVQDDAAKVAAHATEHKIPFPVLKDADNHVANQLDAHRTPEAFVLTAEGAVKYHGRIDDQLGIGFRRPKETRRDLAVALDEVLRGSAVSVPETDTMGCMVARATKRAPSGDVTFTRDVAPILAKNCQECHRPNQVGPMALLTYQDAAAWSDTIKEVVQQRRMPPWHADPRYGHFKNARGLREQEQATLVRWVEEGMPEGDPKDLPPPVHFEDEWEIGKPDVVLTMPEPYDVPAQGPKTGIPYQHFILDPHLEEDKWLVGTEVRVGAPAVVHHSTVYLAAPGDFSINNRLGGAAPGHTAFVLPDGVARRIPKGSKIMLQMHYTPNGTPQKDQTTVGLVFAKSKPKRAVLPANFFNESFRIPPGDPNYRVDSWVTLPADGELITLSPHMHLRGKDVTVEAIRPGQAPEILLSVPHYDYNWQHTYILEHPYRLPKGTKLHAIAHFDNSTKNPNNPDPSIEVKWGLQSWDEMFVQLADVVYDFAPNSPEMHGLELLNTKKSATIGEGGMMSAVH